MKKGRTVTFSNFGAWSAVLLGLFVASACGRTSSPGSGETHFLIRCESGGCGGGLECLCGVCSKPCSNDRACSSLGESVTCVEHDEASCTTVTKSCDVTCAGDAECRRVSLRHVCVDGLCRIGPGLIGSIDEGGAANVGSAGGPSNGGSDSQMTGGGTAGTGAEPGTPVNCSLCGGHSCAIQGGCSKEEACKFIGCGGPSVDEDGCKRPTCVNDSGCDADARCASVVLLGDGYAACRLTNGACQCEATAAGPMYNKICNPIAISGQRGQWTTLRVREWNYEAVTDLTEWVFSADGGVVVSTYSVHGSTTLPAPSNQETKIGDEYGVDGVADSADLRAELSDATPCAPVEDYDLDVVLQLDTGTLEKRMSGCVKDPGRPFQENLGLMPLLEKYRN